MKSLLLAASLLALGGAMPTLAGQAPYGAAAPDIPLSSHDRIYTSDQFSNTVSVVDPSTNKTLGVIRLGDSSPQNFSPLYRGQVLVHGGGFSPDRGTIAIVSIGSNSVTTPGRTRSNMSPMLAAPRTRLSGRRTAGKCG
jgi:YVTN family beta-propeller protein